MDEPASVRGVSQTLDQRESIVAALTKLDEVLLSRRFKLSICVDVKSLCIQFTRRWWRKIRKSRRSWTFAPFASSSLTVKRMRNLSDCARDAHRRHFFQPVEGRSKDYISNPKQNGYQSLHSVVRDKDDNAFEIRVDGVDASHSRSRTRPRLRHKEHAEIRHELPKVDQQIQWARFMLTWQNELYDQQKIRPERVANAVDCGADLAPCMFPIHGADCTTAVSVLPSVRHRRGRSPYIISVVDGAVAVCEMKEHATAADLKFDDQRVPEGSID